MALRGLIVGRSVSLEEFEVIALIWEAAQGSQCILGDGAVEDRPRIATRSNERDALGQKRFILEECGAPTVQLSGCQQPNARRRGSASGSRSDMDTYYYYGN